MSPGSTESNSFSIKQAVTKLDIEYHEEGVKMERIMTFLVDAGVTWKDILVEVGVVLGILYLFIILNNSLLKNFLKKDLNLLNTVLNESRSKVEKSLVAIYSLDKEITDLKNSFNQFKSDILAKEDSNKSEIIDVLKTELFSLNNQTTKIITELKESVAKIIVLENSINEIISSLISSLKELKEQCSDKIEYFLHRMGNI